MCNCRKEFEAQAAAMYPEIKDATAVMSGYMLIPAGHMYSECEITGTRETSKGKVIKSKKVISVLGKFCMFCGVKFEGADQQ